VIVVTGGAGFIGSALVWRLNQRGINDILIVDHLGKSEKWRNLVGLRFLDYLDKSVFISMIESGELDSKISAVLHMGACSATTELDADYLMENNYRYTLRIGKWWEKNKKARFIYASSAATYGDGAQGYDDDASKLYTLKPLNMYGYSKHMFDLWAIDRGAIKQIAGLKYFNVFGPFEDHKADMMSVVAKAYRQIRETGKVQLFKSYNPAYKDGEQMRDFIYVKDAVSVSLALLEDRQTNGLFNCGSGTARTWNDLVTAVFNAMKAPVNIEFIEMPLNLRGKYQYFTEAKMEKLQAAINMPKFRTLEEGITDYVETYLKCVEP